MHVNENRAGCLTLTRLSYHMQRCCVVCANCVHIMGDRRPISDICLSMVSRVSVYVQVLTPFCSLLNGFGNGTGTEPFGNRSGTGPVPERAALAMPNGNGTGTERERNGTGTNRGTPFTERATLGFIDQNPLDPLSNHFSRLPFIYKL